MYVYEAQGVAFKRAFVHFKQFCMLQLGTLWSGSRKEGTFGKNTLQQNYLLTKMIIPLEEVTHITTLDNMKGPGKDKEFIWILFSKLNVLLIWISINVKIPL
jgi:hypothetical protein